MVIENILGDRLEIRGLKIYACVGVHPFEKEEARILLVDLDIWTSSIACAAASDRIEDALDYAGLCMKIRSVGTSQPFQLIETLAEKIAQACLEGSSVQQVRIRVAKPGAVAVAEEIAVSIFRNRNQS